MVIDSIPEDDQLDDNLTKEQDELDEHDIIVDGLSLRLEKLVQDCSPKSSTSGQRIASRKLTNLHERLAHTSTLIGKLKGAPEEFDTLEKYQEQVEYKTELSDIQHYVLSECTPTESDTLLKSIVIDKLLFDNGLSIRE